MDAVLSITEDDLEPAGAAPPPVPFPTGELLRLDSSLRFLPLTIAPHGDGGDFLVGNRDTGVFLSIPEVGVVALQELQAGRTIAQAGAAATAHAGEVVDALDFAAVLVEVGLVTAVDDLPQTRAASGPAQKGWLEGVRPEIVQPFFSRPAWAFYGLLLVGCLGLWLSQPQYWPSFEDLYFYPDPALCLVVTVLTSLILGAGHEMCHWLAGRAAGVAARFSVSRRLFLPVFETDLSQLWSVPRSARYSPFLAGMAFDIVILATCLSLRVLWGSGLLDIPPLLYRFAGTVVLLQVLDLGFQSLVFLRTDLFAVLVTALGCYNLYRVNYLYLLSKLHLLNPPGRAELAAAHPRDLAVARWFAWLYLAGLAWAAYFFISFFLPTTALLAGWMFDSLRGAPPGTAAFWEALIIGLVAALQGLLPLAILARQLIQQRRGKEVLT
jgi:hypothetical protein